jgi:hypothetical protein
MGFNFKATPETGDKETRAEPFAAMVGAERVHLVRGEWNSVFIEELRNFPGGNLQGPGRRGQPRVHWLARFHRPRTQGRN